MPNFSEFSYQNFLNTDLNYLKFFFQLNDFVKDIIPKFQDFRDFYDSIMDS